MVEIYYPELSAAAPDRAAALLGVVVERAAALTARWMTAGFVHGVLNTDNMNITGESFDYGPYRFLPRNDPNFVAAYFDHSGLYSFGRQPEAVFWNLQQLAGAPDPSARQAPLVEALNGFAGAYRAELAGAMVRRLGLTAADTDADVDLGQRRVPRPGRRRRGPALGAVLLRLVRRRCVSEAARSGGPPRRPLWRRRLRGLPRRGWRTASRPAQRLQSPTSRERSRRNCSTTRSRPSGRASPSETTGGHSRPSWPPSSQRGWGGGWRSKREITTNYLFPRTLTRQKRPRSPWRPRFARLDRRPVRAFRGDPGPAADPARPSGDLSRPFRGPAGRPWRPLCAAHRYRAPAALRAGRLCGHRGSPILFPCRVRPRGHGPGDHERFEPGARRPGRLHHHPAVGPKPLPDLRSHHGAQGAGADLCRRARTGLLEEADPRPLPQSHLFRLRRLWHRGCVAALLQPPCRTPDPEGGGHARGHSQITHRL